MNSVHLRKLTTAETRVGCLAGVWPLSVEAAAAHKRSKRTGAEVGPEDKGLAVQLMAAFCHVPPFGSLSRLVSSSPISSYQVEPFHQRLVGASEVMPMTTNYRQCRALLGDAFQHNAGKVDALAHHGRATR